MCTLPAWEGQAERRVCLATSTTALHGEGHDRDLRDQACLRDAPMDKLCGQWMLTVFPRLFVWTRGKNRGAAAAAAAEVRTCRITSSVKLPELGGFHATEV